MTNIEKIETLAWEILSASEDAFGGGSDADEASWDWLAGEILETASRKPGSFASVRRESEEGYPSYGWANIGAFREDDGSIRFGGFPSKRELTTNSAFARGLKKTRSFLVDPDVLEMWRRIGKSVGGLATVATALQIYGTGTVESQLAREALRRTIER